MTIEQRAQRLAPDLGWRRIEPDPLHRWMSPFVQCRLAVTADRFVSGTVICQRDEHGRHKWHGEAGDGREQITMVSRYVGPLYFDLMVAAVSGAVRQLAVMVREVEAERAARALLLDLLQRWCRSRVEQAEEAEMHALWMGALEAGLTWSWPRATRPLEALVSLDGRAVRVAPGPYELRLMDEAPDALAERKLHMIRVLLRKTSHLEVEP